MTAKTTHDLTADSGRRIRVYDDVFSLSYRDFLYSFARTSLFRIGWQDSGALEKAHHHSLHSHYSEEDTIRSGIVGEIFQSSVADELSGYEIAKCILNLSTPSDVNFVHTHPEDKIILVYVNLDWQDGWHGETLFYSESQKEIVFASPFTPNRVVVFDAKIPHTIRPQSHIAPFYRFTLTLVLKKITANPQQ